ncbi:hypothetical protein F5Y13DRAFT_167205 [Hypoxylon sp. FL1857]|nr:hypothetical protein F5Y13DRAFT_167205 [Hypoxylon sp. FL1857]
MDPISILGLSVSAYDIIKRIYSICGTFKNAPEHLKEFCNELVALQDVLGRISSTLQFEAGSSTKGDYASDHFKDTLSSTKDLLDDLLERLQKQRHGWRERVMWVFRQGDIEEYKERIAWRREYFGLVVSLASRDAIQKIHNEIVNLSSQTRLERLDALRGWLGTFDYSQTHSQHLESHAEGTGSWFVDGPLKDWLSRPSTRLLWLRGKSGSGKSCLVSHAIEKTLSTWDDHPKKAVLYFYCSFNFQDRTTEVLRSLLGSLIIQMCGKDTKLWDEVDNVSPLKEARGGPLEPASTDKLRELFYKLSKRFLHLVIFLDAPNEIPEHETLLDELGSAVVNNASTFVRVCISSTPDLCLSAVRTRYQLQCSSVEMDTREQKRDMSKYITLHLTTSRSLSSLPREIKDYITKTLIEKSEGSFRYVECHLESLKTKDSLASVKAAISSIPSSVNKHYRDILQNIPTDFRKRVRRLLRWLVVPTRPLTVNELEILLGDTILNSEDQILPGMMTDILKACGSLVQYDSDTGTVSLGHASVRDFLLSAEFQQDQGLAIKPGKYEEIVMICLLSCLNYLTNNSFQEGYTHDPLHRAKVHRDNPLLSYCAVSLPFYWAQANNAYLLNPGIFDKLSLLCQVGKKNGGFYGNFLQEVAPEYVSTPPAGRPWSLITPLGFAACRGWTFMVEFMVQKGLTADLNTLSGFSMLSPFQRACVHGHREIAKYLLGVGALLIAPPCVIAGWASFVAEVSGRPAGRYTVGHNAFSPPPRSSMLGPITHNASHMGII